MERCLKQYDKECMKMAMMKHEETFRHQVHELHRLYRVQRLLMNDMKNAEQKSQRMYARPRTDRERLMYTETETAVPQQCYSSHQQQINLDHPAEKFIGKNDSSVMLEIDEESDLELTLAIGSRRSKKKEASFTSDSGASFSSSSAESSGVKLNGHEWRLLQVPDVNMSFQRERKSTGFDDAEEEMRQDRMKHPPWLFQCLSLNIS